MLMLLNPKWSYYRKSNGLSGADCFIRNTWKCKHDLEISEHVKIQIQMVLLAIWIARKLHTPFSHFLVGNKNCESSENWDVWRFGKSSVTKVHFEIRSKSLIAHFPILLRLSKCCKTVKRRHISRSFDLDVQNRFMKRSPSGARMFVLGHFYLILTALLPFLNWAIMTMVIWYQNSPY